jgi:hypothetical protein
MDEDSSSQPQTGEQILFDGVRVAPEPFYVWALYLHLKEKAGTLLFYVYQNRYLTNNLVCATKRLNWYAVDSWFLNYSVLKNILFGLILYS